MTTLCETCGGHGQLTTGRTEIPFPELSPRRQEGYLLGRRFHRPTTAPCPDCDGQDRTPSEPPHIAA
ncbi:hypothetical protein RB625_19665 [Streptomyces californicus]|uniref:hypothetical protein n=1 Tax=Streptomyces californicus TaxID=67351 RepID=UPI00296F6B19|nr:hypothetical protein [Streptomyces californicus]MDW4900630.1 hypothetical protein [Streptomyces californicus]